MVGGLDHEYGLWYHTSWASQGALVVKNPPANAEEVKRPGFNSGLPPGRYRGGGHSNLLHYSCLENPMDRGTWRATVLRVVKSWTRLKRLTGYACAVLVRSPLEKLSLNMFLSVKCG